MESRALELGRVSFPTISRSRWSGAALASSSSSLVRFGLLQPLPMHGVPFQDVDSASPTSAAAPWMLRRTRTQIHCHKQEVNSLPAPDKERLSLVCDAAVKFLTKLPLPQSEEGARCILLMHLGMAAIAFLAGFGAIYSEIMKQKEASAGYVPLLLSSAGILTKSVYESLKLAKDVGELAGFFWILTAAAFKCNEKKTEE